MTRNQTRSSRPLCWLAIAWVAAGCQPAPSGPAELEAPGLEPARAVLIASLDAWKAGRRTSGVVTGSNPAVGVVDAARADRPLLEYEVVGPLMVADKSRPFAVRLVLDEPREEVSTRYLVIGRDPLWVYRQDDFERMLHWEHKMDPEAAAAPPGQPAPALK